MPSMPLAARPTAGPADRRFGRAALRLLAALCVALLLCGPARAQVCSPYMGQVKINEVRVGNSGGTDLKNQIELLNIAGVPATVWRTWRFIVFFKDGTRAGVQTGDYLLNTGMVANGDFIYNSTVKYYLRNRADKSIDIALVDASGNFIDYIAIDRRIQTVPACFGATTLAAAFSTSDKAGDLPRITDGGTWAASMTSSATHTIGRTNVCTVAGGDLVVTIEADRSKPIQNFTTVTYTIVAFNNACSASVSSVVLRVNNLTTANFSSLTTSVTGGSVTTSGGDYVWTIGTMAAGLARTFTVTGIPKNLGPLTSTAWVSSPTSGLYETADDTDSRTITVYDANYVGFEIDSVTLTEGTNLSYSASILMNVPTTQSVTVNYTVSGSATASDTNLPASGSVVMLAGETEATIDFTITNDTQYEPTKSIVLTISSVTSADTKVRKGTVPNGDFPVLTITLLDDDALNHYQLLLPSDSLACLASTVTVLACADSSSPCTALATGVGGATATLSTNAGSLSATTVTFDATGRATATLSHGSAANGAVARVTLAGTSITSANPSKCCPDGVGCAVRNFCDSTFTTAGFIISSSLGGAAASIPAQTAGTASGSYFLRAVRTSTSTKACEPALTGSTTVNWGAQCINPTTCSAGNRMTLTGNSAVAIASNPNTGVVSTTAVPMTFDANGNAPFNFNYADAGLVLLSATKAPSGALTSTLSGLSNSFVVRPANLLLSAIRCTSYAAGSCATTAIASPGNNPAASLPSGTAFMPAGQPFSATVTAVDALGNATPNFGRETSPEGVSLSMSLVSPTGGLAPALANPSAFGAFSGGVATGTSFSWPEVGIITLQPSITSGSYLGAGNVTGSASANVGRFIPHHFNISHTPACSGLFSYAGQTFASAVSARNSADGLTTNYDGSGATSPAFAKAVTLSDASALGVGTLAGTAVAAVGFNRGLASAAPNYSFSTKATAPRSLVLRAIDSDAVSSAGFTEGTMALRSGRLRLSNAFGKSNAALQLPVAAEYWGGNSWVPNSADSCTTLVAGNVALSNPRNSSGGASAATSSVSAVSLSGGVGSLALAAPTPAGSSLTLDVALNLGSTTADLSCLSLHPATTGAAKAWLRAPNGSCSVSDRDPAARASFGIFSPETRKTVYVRDLY